MAHPYQTIAEDILARIRRGEWTKGDRLPGLRDLEQQYPHSRVTLHRALRLLSDRGYLQTARGSGTYVRATHVRERVGILAGGLALSGVQSPFALRCTESARGWLTRCGMEPRVYSEDPLSANRMPSELQNDLREHNLKGLLTVQSVFSIGFMRSEFWRADPIPHVDIGSLEAPWRVYIDLAAFVHDAVALARADGRRHIMVIARGTGMEREVLRRRFPGSDVEIYPRSDGPALAHEPWGFRAMLDICSASPRPDALVCAGGNIAKGIAQAALKMGVDVPDEIAIISLTNTGLELFYPIPITCFPFDIESMVVCAGELLLRRINEPGLSPETILLPAEVPPTLAAGLRGPADAWP